MQAIQTKYVAPTDRLGARILAKCDAGSIRVPWRDNLNVPDNHRRAAAELARRLEWNRPIYGSMVSGCLSDGSYCHVFDSGFIGEIVAHLYADRHTGELTGENTIPEKSAADFVECVSAIVDRYGFTPESVK